MDKDKLSLLNTAVWTVITLACAVYGDRAAIKVNIEASEGRQGNTERTPGLSPQLSGPGGGFFSFQDIRVLMAWGSLERSLHQLSGAVS